jgi:hypothetical protein
MADLKSLSPKSGSKKAQAVDKKGSDWVSILVWFLVVAILAYVLLYTFNPEILQKKDASGKPTGVSDPMWTIAASVAIGLVVAVILYFVKRK